MDYRDSFAIVAETMGEKGGEIVGIARYYRLPVMTSAELGIVVENAYQRKGIGTRLLSLLTEAARDNGINVFEADVLVENVNMMVFFRNCGFPLTSRLEDEVYHVTLLLAE